MKRKLKQFLSALLVAVMLLTAAPLSGFVGLDLPNLADLFTLKVDAATYSGKCGDNLTWSLDTDTGVLTISGTGDMYDWSYDSDVPWYSNRSSVKTVVIGDSVTSIGGSAFGYCDSLTSITIPDSVTSIDYGAFYNCTSLTSVTIGNSVTSIGRSAFGYCTGLTSVTIPGSVTSIGDDAFEDCTGLTSVTIPDSVTSIGDWAFAQCTGLTSITIPDSVTSIGKCAFRQCKSLKSVAIGNGLEKISEFTFYECDSLENITIGSNVYYIDEKAFYGCGKLNKVNYTGTIEDWCEIHFYNALSNPITYANCLYINGKSVGDIVISSNALKIGQYAFYNCKNITSVTIGNSVTSIGEQAFYSCSGLTSVVIPDSVKLIGKSAFCLCRNLKNVIIGDGVKIIDYNAFSYCKELENLVIGNDVETIGTDAFSECTSLTSVVIPDSVKLIGNSAFYSCSGLTSITIGNSVTSIGEYAFYSCSNLKSITIPYSVMSIGEKTFSKCTNLSNVTIPDSVASISYNSFDDTELFNNSDNWQNDVLYIGNHLIKAQNTINGEYAIKTGTITLASCAFKNCNNLTNIIIPESVKLIGYDAFDNTGYYNNSDNWQNDVLYIGKHLIKAKNTINGEYIIETGTVTLASCAFENCANLTKIVIPSSISLIGSDVFSCCSKLKNVNYKGTRDEWCRIIFMNRASNPLWCSGNLYIKEESVGDVIIPKDVSNIDYLFCNCQNITSIVIPDNVTSIGEYAFSYCRNLKEVTIGNGVKTIGNCAFKDCTNLTNVTINKGAKTIGRWAFDNCKKITYVNYTGSREDWCRINFGSNPISGSENCNLYINGEPVGDVVIPKDVSNIHNLFAGCKNITSVMIPDGVKSIDSQAFEYCSGLQSVIISNSVKFIGWSSFAGCTKLSNITIGNSVKRIESETFRYCSSLTSITIPNSVKSIEEEAFYGCSSLVSVTFPDSIISIGDGAFLRCAGLTNVTIPDSTISIGDGAFSGCVGLTNITIPDSVMSIGRNPFSGCVNLISIVVDSNNPIYDSRNDCNAIVNSSTKILISACKKTYIPDTVTSIGEYAFCNCTGLTSISIPDSVTSIGSWAFEDCTGLTSVTIPDSVTSIGYWAFYKCTGLTSVTIGNSVTSIGDNAFYRCTRLTDVYYTGSEEDWNKISFGSGYGYLTNATIHYLGSELSYTQTHTVNNYSKKNTQYASNYLISAGTALDGQNSTPSTVIPGLKNGENMVPQGIAHYKNKFLITSYFNDASGTKKPSMIFAINSTSGKLVKEYKMRYDDGENSFDITGHVGGIAVSGDNIYVADGKYIYYIKAENMNNGIATATARKKISGMNGFSSDVSCSYVTITDGILWTGNFYDGYDSRYKKPANSSNNSVVLGFSLNGTGDETEWQAFNQKTQPDVKIDIPDKIENIQCATVYNKKLILTTSFGRKNTSKLYVTGISDNFKFMDSTTNTFTGLPMMEGSVIKDGYMYGINESGAYYYNGYGELSKDPTDVVWKYNLGKILNMDITSSTDGDVVNKSAEFVDGKKGIVNEINFKQSWFMQDSMEYNHQLAILCSQYAMIGYDNVNDEKPNLEKALSTLGMSNIEIQPTASRNQVNYFLANRKINVSGKQYTLIFAGFIGSYHDQWYSNFDPGTGDTHQGFNSAKEYVYGKLENYINKLGVSKDDTKILITGHSRGAATANLVAAKLIKEQKYASASNVYTYAFATPNSTKLEEKDNAEYKRIFNFVNPEDFVTKCMPASWRYGRYGTTFVLPSKTNTTNYSKYKDKMQSYFYQFSGEQEYKNYITGEAAAYTAVKSLTTLVRNVNLFYALPLMAGMVPMTTYAFFQNTLCHFVSHTASALDFAAAGAIIVETLGTSTSCFAYRDILNYFITNGALSSHFADSHSATTYCAFVSSMSSADMYYRSGFLGSVNCPVDVEVYDKTTGELVGRIVDNAVDETIAAKENSIVMTVDGDSKQYWLPSDGDFEVKLIGNDDGAMDYSVAAVDSDTGETERVNFFDVDIVKGEAMTGEVNADEFAIEKYTLEKETGETLEPTEQTDDVAEVEINTSAFGKGTVSESITATSGDYVTVYATPDEGYVFKGWYDGKKLISTDAEYSFVAKENVSLTARFEPEDYVATLIGDVNGDNNINSSDALLILQYIVEFRSLSSYEELSADVNHDNEINSFDALLVLKYSTGEIDSFENA